LLALHENFTEHAVVVAGKYRNSIWLRERKCRNYIWTHERKCRNYQKCNFTGETLKIDEKGSNFKNFK
jgi:hypothetical protein